MRIRGVSLVVLLAISGFASLARAAERANVLFIFADDLNTHLGSYGHPQAKTPNLDELAARGLRFDRAFSQFPLCNPSRVSMLTGLRPDTAGVAGQERHFREAARPDVITLPQLFRRNGYHVVGLGKVFHTGLDDTGSWDERLVPRRPEGRRKAPAIHLTPTRGIPAAGLSYRIAEGSAEDELDGVMAAQAIAILERNRDRPFFLAVGFHQPHAPYTATQEYFDLHPLDGITLPDEPLRHRGTLPPAAILSTAPYPNFDLPRSRLREAKRAYYAAVSFLDAQVGKLLDALQRLELADRTIVVFWSDHGYHLGEHGLWLKNSLFEEATRVPLIIAAPGRARARACTRTVELLDLYPTLAALAGLDPPRGLEGASLVPLLDDPATTWGRPAYSQVWRGTYAGRSVRTERWRYTEWDGGRQGRELYDHEVDPNEYRNLAGDPAYAVVVEELRGLLRSRRGAKSGRRP